MTRRRRSAFRRLLAALNTQWFGGVLFLVMGVVFAGLALDTLDLNAHVGPDAPVAEARVLEVYPGRRSWVVLEFTTAEGRAVRTETEEVYWDPEPRVGDVIRVRYHPDDPARYVRDVRMRFNRFTVAFHAAFAALFLAGAVAGFRGRLPRWVVER